MKSQQGIALISALLLLVAILGIGIGMLFLSRMTISQAENVRANALARAEADIGTDAVVASVAHYYKTTNKLPAESVLTTMSVITPTQTLSYTQNADFTYKPDTTLTKEYKLRVLGNTASNGAFIGEALVVVGAVSSKLFGVVSEGAVSIASGTSIYTDAGVHGNAGVNLGNNDFYQCLTRDPATGMCSSTQELHGADIPVSTSNNSSCTVKGENYTACQRDEPLVTVTPDYIKKRDAAILAANVQNASPSRTGTLSSANNIYCDKVVNNTTVSSVISTDIQPGKVLCVEGTGVTLPSASLSGVTVIADGNISLSGTPVSLTANTTLISKSGTVNLGKPSSVTDSHIFSQGSLDYNGPNNTFGGVSTIASAGNISIGGSSSIATDLNGSKGIGVAIVAEGSIDVNGSSNWFAGIIAGGTFSANGGPTLFGGIQARGAISISGGIDIDSGMGVLNNNLAETEPSVLSRR